MPDPTTNFTWDLPDVGGDVGQWGTLLNNILDSIDSNLHTAKTLAEAALPRAGGEISGEVLVARDRYAIGAIGSDNTAALNLANRRCFTLTITGNASIIFQNVPATGFVFVALNVAHNQARTITWPNSVSWPANEAPVLQSGGNSIFHLQTWDGGTNWYGVWVGTFS